MVTRNDIADGLLALGLTAGDIVLVHSSLSSLGRVDGGAETVVCAFIDVLGKSGTLLVPTFGDFGAIMAAVKSRADAVSSIHPRASVAAVGARAEEICRDHWKAQTAHGEDTPYTRIAQLGGYVCLLGVDQDRNTSLHSVEALLELPYLKTTPEVTFTTPEGEMTRSWRHAPGPHRDFIGLDRELRERGIVRLRRIGDAAVRLMNSREMIDHLLEVGRTDPAFALCGNQECADCTAQRADIRRHRFSLECFQVAATASLAGTTAAEIARSCADAGVDAVVLDGLGDSPVEDLTPVAVAEATEGLRASGCKVTALRVATVPGDLRELLNTAREAGVGRLVVPLTDGAPQVAVAAAAAGVTVSFYNTALESERVFEHMDRLRTDGLDARLTFSPVEFVRVGEKPFLTSLRQKLKRFTDQLDLEDATFAGDPTSLTRGNGELKELVSVLRCSSFSGTVCLGASNAAVGDLRQAATDFELLLAGL